jgi:hypothetical protein
MECFGNARAYLCGPYVDSEREFAIAVMAAAAPVMIYDIVTAAGRSVSSGDIGEWCGILDRMAADKTTMTGLRTMSSCLSTYHRIGGKHFTAGVTRGQVSEAAPLYWKPVIEQAIFNESGSIHE